MKIKFELPWISRKKYDALKEQYLKAQIRYEPQINRLKKEVGELRENNRSQYKECESLQNKLNIALAAETHSGLVFIDRKSLNLSTFHSPGRIEDFNVQAVTFSCSLSFCGFEILKTDFPKYLHEKLYHLIIKEIRKQKIIG